VLSSPPEVIRSLVTYSDWWQPLSTSIIQTGAARRSNQVSSGFRPGMVETLDERSELCRRMAHLEDEDRTLLFLWYVRQVTAGEVARELGISRRQCFRRRSRAVQSLVDLGEAA
jgi:DNA-directed RNA polymerase specialized sigma24 family protein